MCGNFNLYLGHKGTVHKKLSLLIKDIPGLGEVLRTINDISPEDAYNQYLHDFVRMVYGSLGRSLDTELKVRNVYGIVGWVWDYISS